MLGPKTPQSWDQQGRFFWRLGGRACPGLCPNLGVLLAILGVTWLVAASLQSLRPSSYDLPIPAALRLLLSISGKLLDLG